ncbi:MAG: hypothetical protein ACE5OZ_11500 [Candidatus Heimdallarchaeota archaeon]
MKIRTGFVSNSSSSSFILAVAKDFDSKAPITLKYEVDLGKMVTTTITTEEALRKYILEESLLWEREVFCQSPSIKRRSRLFNMERRCC